MDAPLVSSPDERRSVCITGEKVAPSPMRTRDEVRPNRNGNRGLGLVIQESGNIWEVRELDKIAEHRPSNGTAGTPDRPGSIQVGRFTRTKTIRQSGPRRIHAPL